MITAIPNQPLNFGGSLLAGCKCDELEPQLMFDKVEDQLTFQLGYQPCFGGTQLIPNPDFAGANWDTKGPWTLAAGRACVSGTALASIADLSFDPVPGTMYVLIIEVRELTGEAHFSIGGYQGAFTTAATYTYAFTATSVAGFLLTLNEDTDSICMSMVSLYLATTDITVDILDVNGAVSCTFDPAADPDNFTFTGTHVVFDATIGGCDIEGCFTVRVTETCGVTNTILTSQQMRTVSDDCTLKITACAGASAFGLVDFPMGIRLDARLVRPTYEYDVKEERRSDGRILRHYADRQRVMELRIGLQSEYVHPFIAMLPLFPHVYIGQQEFVVDAETYAPLYADVFDGTGGIIMTVRPKEELVRYVMCGTETEGCVPPPNLLVQGTGPNNDLILLENGSAILLNP